MGSDSKATGWNKTGRRSLSKLSSQTKEQKTLIITDTGVDTDHTRLAQENSERIQQHVRVLKRLK